MKHIKKAIGIKAFITHLELAFSSKNKTESLQLIPEMIKDVIKGGIVKPTHTRDFEKAITLLNQLEKKTADTGFKEDILEVKNRFEVAKNLTNYKENAQYSSRELATKADLSHTYISRIESCQLSVPSSKAIKSLAVALVIEPQMLDPHYVGDKPDFLLSAYKNPITREILTELYGVNDQALEFFLRFVKDIKNLSKNNIQFSMPLETPTES